MALLHYAGALLSRSTLDDATFFGMIKESRVMDVKDQDQWDWALLYELASNPASFTRKRVEVRPKCLPQRHKRCVA